MKNIEKELEKLRAEQLQKLCPVFRTKCEGERCMSYASGYMWTKNIGPGVVFRVNEGMPGEQILSPPGCTNAIVTGAIEYQEL